MPSKYRIRYLLSAPVIVLVGLVAIFWGGRAVAFGGRARHWADSLDKGSGPVRLEIPFVPIFVSGTKVGSLDTVVVQRHRRGVVDSLRIVVKPLAAANAEKLAACAYHLQNLDQFEPDQYPRALSCAADTVGMVRFGRVAFGRGQEASLFVDAEEVACEDLQDDADAPPAVVAGAVARTVSKSVSTRVSTGVATSTRVAASASASAAASANAEAETVCTQPAMSRAKSHWRKQGVSKTEIQRIVREATAQARQAQEQGRLARDEARRAAEAARHQR